MPKYAIRSTLALTAAGAVYYLRSLSHELPSESEATAIVAALPVEAPLVSASPNEVPVADTVAAVGHAITRRLPRRAPIRLDLR